MTHVSGTIPTIGRSVHFYWSDGAQTHGPLHAVVVAINADSGLVNLMVSNSGDLQGPLSANPHWQVDNPIPPVVWLERLVPWSQHRGQPNTWSWPPRI